MHLAAAQWRESGLTQKAYCDKIGVKRTTFANWVERSKEKPEHSGFLVIPPPIKPAPEALEII